MKVGTQQHNVQSGGMNLEVNYRIAANKKSFDVLSRDMYSNIIPTIVRELSSNAFDAHREAGTPDLPFTVGCPTAFDPYLTVSDDGTGLRYYKFNAKIRNDASKDVEGDITSTIFIKGDIRRDVADIDTIILTQNGSSRTISVPSYLYDKSKDVTCLRIHGEFKGDDVIVEFDDTLVLYSTYFKSTKDETDDYIGGYGLGAKTPLAYTDAFMVTNRFGGTERIYSIYKNADGMPCINLMGCDATDAHDGMEVKMGVDPSDYIEFKEAIENQLKFFDPQPEVLNNTVEMPQVLHTGKYFLLMDTENQDSGYGYSRKSSASVGFNAYNIQYVESSLFGENLALRFNIGEVKVTASREELKYDDVTIEMIRQREKDAMNEYRDYILDHIDTTGMKDWEKAEFLNNNHNILDLTSDRIKELVGNPHYRYTKRNILIPITGWGDYTELYYSDDYTNKVVNGAVVYDQDGRVVQVKTGTTLKTHMCNTKRALTWSEYCLYNMKTSKMSLDQTIYPTQKLLVFVRDNSFSFLKKIAYYCEKHDIDRYSGTDVMVLDMFSDANMTSKSLKIIRELIGHTATFVHLSGITLPKNISLIPSSLYTTPTARLFDPEKHNFRNPKYWSDVYTPLTKIDTDAYIVQSHRGAFDDMGWSDQCFIETYLKSGYDWDESITVLVMSRARYEKAIKYGFKPIEELVAELKTNILIPVDVVHSDMFDTLYRKIKYVDVIGLTQDFTPEDFEKLNVDSNVKKLIRVRDIIKTRYVDKEEQNRSMRSMIEYMGEGTTLPEALDSVKEMIDIVTKLCDTVDSGYTLVDNRNYWFFETDERKAELIDYINYYETKSKPQEQDEDE